MGSGTLLWDNFLLPTELHGRKRYIHGADFSVEGSWRPCTISTPPPSKGFLQREIYTIATLQVLRMENHKLSYDMVNPKNWILCAHLPQKYMYHIHLYHIYILCMYLSYITHIYNVYHIYHTNTYVSHIIYHIYIIQVYITHILYNMT